ncbi:MAG: hypothetical protein EOM23_01650 [Candidatus Moranbacteria bacterium]|nr:hypothetical protein [Candidatus Moranbacteria bacterium]
MIRKITEIDENIKKKYKQKGKDSFKSVFSLFLFDNILSDQMDQYSLKESKDKLIGAFGNYQIEQKKVDFYIAKYWAPSDENKKITDKLKIKEVYEKMRPWLETKKNSKFYNDYMCNCFKELERYYEGQFKKIFPIKDFQNMLKTAKKCHYCNITKEEIDILINAGKLFKKHITRGWDFEIDRKNPSLEYSKENCVICCYWCNNAKTDGV